MSFLLDTNVLSEIRKGRRMNPTVAAWYDTTESEGLYVSVIAFGEIQTGVLLKQRKDPAAGAVLAKWITVLRHEYRSRVLPVSLEDALLWGQWESVRNRPTADTLQAATAFNLGYTFVTRNEADFTGLPVMILNPWHYQPVS